MSSQNGEDLREQPVGQLLKQLSEQTSTLVKQELALARAEMTQKGKKLGMGVGLIGGGGLAALLALGSFTAFLILVLSEAMDGWLAALIVTLLWAAVAGVLALIGKERIEEAPPLTPEQTIDTLKEDAEWAKTQMRSDAR